MTSLPVRILLYGVVDPGQAAEAAALGVDAVVVDLGPGSPAEVSVERARAIADALPPFTQAWARLPGPASPPSGYDGIVVDARDDLAPPSARTRWVARLPGDESVLAGLAATPAALWVRPRVGGTSSATRHDYRVVERWARRHRIVLEIPEGAAGVEIAVRLGRPYAVLLGEGVWFRPGIVDLQAVESAVGVVARLNRRCFG